MSIKIMCMHITEPGIGKAELFQRSREGLGSARTDGKNRLTYRVDGDRVPIVSCRGHYEDR